MTKASGLGADSVILDLEDAVAFSEKEGARSKVVAALAGLDFGRTERLVRINALDTEMFAADLAAIAKAKPDGIVIPKVETALQVQQIDDFLVARESPGERPARATGLLVLIETALGVLNVKEIAQSCSRLDGLMFGAEDLAADVGATRTEAGWEVFYARSAVVTAAAAYGLDSIDGVFLDLHDLDGLEKDAGFSQRMGYTGKMAIHPRQIEVLNRVFSPSPAEIAKAQRLLEAFESHVAAGSGVFTLDGRMVDMPLVRSAERLLERARLSGLLDE
jgi:citrate lyase beta subunit